MSDTPDYLGMRQVEVEEDAEHHGVKGMKWGIRRSKAQLEAAAKKSGGSTETQKNDGPETSSQRYTRLKAAAASGKAGSLSDDDLKWFNARSEALAKINKMNQSKPGWLNKTVNDVIKQVAQEQIKSIASNAANKHISGPINNAVNAKK